MYDESILELEEIEGDDRWHPSVVEARYKTYRDAKEWELAMTMARVLAEGMPDRYEWLKNQADAMTQCGDTAGALQLLKGISDDDETASYVSTFLSRAHELKGKYDKALKHAHEALEYCIKEYGEEDSDVAVCYSDIGEVYHGKKDYEKAIE